MEGLSAFLFTLGGLVIGWALTQATEWLRRKDDYRRTYREVLSYLLDFYHLLQALRVDVKPALNQIVKAMAVERGENMSQDDVDRSVGEYPLAQLNQQMESLVGPRLVELKASYAVSVQQLARLDPVLAYSLRYQDDFLTLLDQVRSQITTVGLSTPEELAMARRMFDDIAKPQVLADTSGRVRELIVTVASKVNDRTRKDALELVTKMDSMEADTGTDGRIAQVIAKHLNGGVGNMAEPHES